MGPKSRQRYTPFPSLLGPCSSEGVSEHPSAHFGTLSFRCWLLLAPLWVVLGCFGIESWLFSGPLAFASHLHFWVHPDCRDLLAPAVMYVAVAAGIS